MPASAPDRHSLNCVRLTQQIAGHMGTDGVAFVAHTRRLPVCCWVVSKFGDVCFGSKADMTGRICDVRFTPESGHWRSEFRCPLCAKSGHDSGAADRQSPLSCTVTPRSPNTPFAYRKMAAPRGERPSCGNSAHVVCPPLGFGLNDSLWFRWQLKNGSLLTLTQRC